MSKTNIMLQVPKTRQLFESAKNMQANPRNISNFSLEIGEEDFFQIDQTFSAIPVFETPDQSSFAFNSDTSNIDAAETETYIVRGEVKTERLDEFTQQSENAGIGVYSDPKISSLRGGVSHSRAPIGDTAHVRSKMGSAALNRAGLNGEGVAIAIVDTGINLRHLLKQCGSARLDNSFNWRPSLVAQPNSPGQWHVGHGTMCAYDALICAPQATLLDFPLLQSRRRGESSMDGLLSDAVSAYSYLLRYLLDPFRGQAYDSLVVNNSWGMYNSSWDFPKRHSGRYADNPNHPFNIIVSSLSRAGADILFAAGNCGDECADGRCGGEFNIITGANGHPDVLSVAGVDINEDRLCYSTKGPGLLDEQKPDISSYTHFLGSRAFGNNSADTGTSTACPVAAGAIAAIRSRHTSSSISPKKLNDVIRKVADNPSNTSIWTREFGYGIIKPKRIITEIETPIA